MDLLHLSGASVVVSRSLAPDDSCCAAVTHGDFDNDPPTMTSVLLRVLGKKSIQTVQAFQPHADLMPSAPVAAAGISMEAPTAAPDGAGNGHDMEYAGDAGEMRSFSLESAAEAQPAPEPVKEVQELSTPISSVLSRLGWRK